MPKLKTTTKARLAAIMPTAVAGGYTIERIARECGCGRKAAGAALEAHCSQKAKEAAIEGGETVSEMQRVALGQRRLVTDRLARVGEICDKLLAEAASLLEGLQSTQMGLERVGTDSGGVEAQSGRPLDRLVVLDKLSNILVRVGKVAETNWALFRSASGLDLAERLTEFSARQKLKAGKDDGAEVWEANFELIVS